MAKSRRKSREFALQGLYQWKLTAGATEDIQKQLQATDGFAKADGEHFADLLQGALRNREALEAALNPHLDRPMAELSPVEYAILLLAAYELQHHLDIPYRVVLNEAVELAKTFGGTDGYKYVNGVLDKLAAQVRAVEISAKKRG
jgi:transcription antitermination protein NusB